MWNIIEYNQIARGEGVRLFTACGIFEGVYRGAAEAEQIHMSDANVQLSQIIALDLDNG